MFDLMPFGRNERTLSHYFDNFDKEFFGMFDSCKTDIEDKGDHFLLSAELPGFRKEDIHLDVDNNRLTISAQHSNEQETKEKNFVRRERSYGSYQRSFDISAVRHEDIVADYKNGILEIMLPKREEAKPVSRRLEIRS